MQPIEVQPRRMVTTERDFLPAVPMPLSLRLRVRQLGRFINSLRPMRTGVGSVLALSLLAGSWTWGAVVGGHGAALSSGIASSVGLKAKNIVITGMVETSKDDVVAALHLGAGRSLVGFDADAARKRLLNLPWVRAVAIRKLYPGKLTVALAERKPVAVWQHKDHLTVIDRAGDKIAGFGITDLISNRFSHLPHLVGNGAASKAGTILPLASRYPEIASRATAYVRVGDRRWNIELVDGMRLQLPQRGINIALERVARLQSEDRLLERQIALIDLRLPDRLVMRLEEDAAKERSELVSTRLKAMKKAERKL